MDNMHDESLVAYRLIYDTVTYKGGLECLELTKALLLSVRNSHSRYMEDIKQRKIADEKNLEAQGTKRKQELEARDLEMKRLKLLQNAQREAAALEEQIAMLRKK